ncbi:2778_t:CDS:2 [Cetraspora pellucida]|uniref:2778_t:CDS:1 n=1 Tax=Cetraspora pellucida TaxID=1433469 RepID=A0A9N9HBL3_9GLOM|nr:2778_t:CDS:2 [Cetraspora pellucida]
MTPNSFITELEEAVSCQNINLFDYNEFTDFERINRGKLSEVYKCKWKDYDRIVILKSLNIDSNLQIIRENTENILIHKERMMISYSISIDNMHVTYVAPEVLLTKTYTHKADIYSLGIILYEITTGLSPYYNIPDDVDLTSNICNGIRPELPNSTPKLISQIISHCWDAKPSRRPNIEKLLTHLHLVIEKNENPVDIDDVSCHEGVWEGF